MTWLLWRQHRNQVVISAVLLAAFAVAVAVTGVHMANVYAGVKACTLNVRCVAPRLFLGYGAIIDVVHLTVIVPVLLGALVAAPLIAREAEQHTNGLVWTQSVTRRRWMLGKVAAVVAGSVALGIAVSVLVTWWSSTTNSLNGDRFQGAQFDTQNLAPVAYTLFAVGLGLLVGALARRTLPAVATTVGIYVVVRVAVAVFLRPHWLAPRSVRSAALSSAILPKGSWTMSQKLVDAAGHSANGRLPVPASCGITDRAVQTCLNRLGYHVTTTYQPASHYWPFQIIESSLFAGVGMALVVAAIAWTLHHDA